MRRACPRPQRVISGKYSLSLARSLTLPKTFLHEYARDPIGDLTGISLSHSDGSECFFRGNLRLLNSLALGGVSARECKRATMSSRKKNKNKARDDNQKLYREITLCVHIASKKKHIEKYRLDARNRMEKREEGERERNIVSLQKYK